MEQIRFLLTEYANEMIMGYGILILTLLLVTLHRIKRIGRQMRAMAEEQASALAAIAEAYEKAAVLEAEEVGAREADTANGTALTAESCVDTTSGTIPVKKNDQEELLDAVLGEVFP